MNFLVDAQLPRRIALMLRSQGHDAVYTLDLPAANRTPDSVILQVAAAEGRVVVTKDADFLLSHLVAGEPAKLLLIATGNISNADLESLLSIHMAAIIDAFESSGFVELSRTALIIHL